MLQWLKRKAETRRIGHQIYERIVAQARDPVLFRDFRVPDTMEGRFEMIVLHLALVLDRLKTEGAPGQRLGQLLMEHLMTDLDDALRQIGIGDMGVPRRVKKAAAAFVERVRDYDDVLRSGGSADDASRDRDGLVSVFEQHVYGATGDTTRHAEKLAAYTRTASAHLGSIASDDIFLGRNLFPSSSSASGAGR